MQTKKTSKANLENKKSLFFQAGLIIALALTLIAFEWGSRTMNNHYTLGNNIDEYEPILLPPSTDFNKPKVNPPDPIVTEFEIVDKVDEDFIDEMPNWNVEENPFANRPFDFFEEEEEEGEDDPFVRAEKMPTFNGGGIKKFQEYLYQNIRYPDVAQSNNISGKVIAQFVVNREGEIESIKILRSIDESLSQEVIRVLTNAPKWTPGEQRGQKVKVIFSIPVYFTLNK